MSEIQEINTDFELYDYIPLGVCIIDINYSVVFWNYYIEKWTQIKRKDILGKNVGDFFNKFTIPKYKFHIDSVLAGGPPVIFSSKLHVNIFTSELEPHLRKIEHITLSALPKQESKEYYAMFSIEDVSELTFKIKLFKSMRDQALYEIENRKKIETELKHSQTTLQVLNATKDKFFSIIAHDLINPISGFKLVTEMLTDKFFAVSDEERVNFLLNLKESSHTILELLQNLLTWSRSQSGRIEFTPKSLNLSNLISTNLSLNKMNADNKKISLINNSSENIIVKADQNMVLTVIRNLITNAIKFTLEGGSITIETNIYTQDKEVVVSVIDTGIGMTPEQLEKLFKIESSFTTPGTNYEKGTGLGLIICKEFIEKHHGRIWVESEQGVGSKFMFSLPLFLIHTI